MKRLNIMLADERKAPHDYHKLLRQLDKKTDKKIIKGIIKQEQEHYKKLILIKKRLNK